MIKIFGIERSCTNYVKDLITLNFGILPYTSLFCHKHQRADIAEWIANNPEMELFYRTCTLKTVICCKNPYHWYLSIMEYARITPEQKEKNPVRLLSRYNEMYLHWHNVLIENTHPFFQPVIIIKHEDLLKDLKDTLNKIAPVESVKDIDKVRISEPFTNEKRRYYIEPLVMGQSERDLVNSLVSDEFFTKYGYERNL